jgi:hypothetical protein
MISLLELTLESSLDNGNVGSGRVLSVDSYEE